MGMRLVLVSRNIAKLEELSENLSNEALVYSYDLKDLENIENIFKFCLENEVVLDGMVFCAGINRDMPIRTNDVAVMKEVMTVNHMAFIELIKFFGRKKYSNIGSSIVAVSSLATRTIAAGMSTYTASKAALEATVQVAAKEFLKREIRVNAVQPACVDTEMIENAPFVNLDSLRASQPLGLIEPVHISYLIEFLLSDKARYITGALIPVSGGAI